jgi:effector-binding domain-containing protein
MKALKITGIILLLLVIAFFAIALLTPKDFHVESEVTIDKPARMVFKEVNNFRNWQAWSPWAKEDPEMTSTYEGPPIGVGAKQVWKSEKMGDGTQTITASIPYSRIETDLDFYEMGVATSYFSFEESDGKTNVKWGFNTETKFPVQRVMFVFFKGSMQSMFNQGLEDLKALVEKKPDAPLVEDSEFPEMTVISIVDSCHWEEGPVKMDKLFERLSSTIESRGLAMTGLPYTQYLVWDPGRQYMVFETGFPVNKMITSRHNIMSKQLSRKRALKSTHYGAYNQSGVVYTALDEYVMEHGLEITEGPIEVYVTGPDDEPDTTKWRTDIYYPIR